MERNVTEHVFLRFDGLDHPVALHDADAIEALVEDVLALWPHGRVDAATAPSDDPAPFVSIAPVAAQSADAQAQKYTLRALDADGVLGGAREWDGVNTLCDLVAEMAWERLRSDPSLLCLHAAAAAFNGRLVVFPNARRAGKSTFTAGLAHLGHQIFTDDFLPVRFDADTQGFHGVANGAAPRIRLPLPDDFSADFHDWVAQDRGPSNRQYKYLTSAPLAQGGAQLPLGAMVVLERSQTPVAPRLDPLDREAALESLITQNFARTLHAGTILTSTDTLTQHVPLYRLTYSNAQDAAAFLSSHPAFATWPDAGIARADGGANAGADTAAKIDARQAPLDTGVHAMPEFLPDMAYVQAESITEVAAGSDHFLADAQGMSIYRLNPLSSAIWRLLSAATTVAEVIDLVSEAYPDVPAEHIDRDCTALMCGLAQAGLIVAADPISDPISAQNSGQVAAAQ